MELKEALLSLKKSMDDFLERAVKKEDEEWEVDQKVSSLENIVLGKSKDFWQIKDRFKGMEVWLKNEGEELNSKPVKKNQIQRVIECIERMKVYWEIIRGEKFYQDGERTLKQANLFIRENLRRRGWEYTPFRVGRFCAVGRVTPQLERGDKKFRRRRYGPQKQVSENFELPA